MIYFNSNTISHVHCILCFLIESGKLNYIQMYWPAHNILVLIVYSQMYIININMDISTKARNLLLVRTFIYYHALFMRAVKALARLSIAELPICEDSPEPPMHADHGDMYRMFVHWPYYNVYHMTSRREVK